MTAGGRPVAGLTAVDFELRDSGVPQQVQVVSFADVPISLLLALDVSSSVEGERLEQLKVAAREAIGALRPGDQAAVLTFTDRISRLSTWTSDLTSVSPRIETLRAQGWTALYDAIASAVSIREQASGRVVVLVFSDGADTASWLDAPTVIEAARHSDVVVTAVSAAPRVQTASGREARLAFGLEAALRRWFETDPALFPYAFLEVLTSETGGQYLHVRSDRELSSAFRRIVAEFKTRYLLTYPPKGVPASGWHPLEVRVTTRRAEVKARRGYWR
jgi:Ca-activated chloride channel homolog